MNHPFTHKSLVIAIIPLLLGAIIPSQTLRVQEQIILNSTDTDPYLELSVEPPVAFPGRLIKLHITYHDIGLPYTMISIDPPGLVALDPPLTMPCKYNQHLDGCKVITLRTLASGGVHFRAGATGEVFDEDCGCWIWGTATDNGPAHLIILETTWRGFLPSIQR
jgi:hypothetical protein